MTLLTSEWGSSKGGLSTINRELAIQLAKYDNVEVCMYLPSFSDGDKNAAADCRVILLKAKERAGYNDPIEWLTIIPRDHQMDAVIGHGIHLGKQVPLIKEMHPECKWFKLFILTLKNMSCLRAILTRLPKLRRSMRLRSN